MNDESIGTIVNVSVWFGLELGSTGSNNRSWIGSDGRDINWTPWSNNSGINSYTWLGVASEL